eukprot:4417352-Ditylum_brightwellii.AAC.1
MMFGLDKYAILYIKNGVYSTTNILPEITWLDNDANKGYRYLGIMEGTDFLYVKVEQNTQKEYIF